MARARVGHFATSDGRQPAVVPVCFVLIRNRLYHAIDAKPKADPRRLRRLANIRANPRAALLVDHYEEDWRRLWFAVFHGRPRVIQEGPEHRRALAALRRKYQQYRTALPLSSAAPVIALDVERVTRWVSEPGRRRAGRTSRPG